MPGSFTFRVGTPVEFGGPTIRAVRESGGGDMIGVEESGGSSGVNASKRKFAAFVGEEMEEKENWCGDVEGSEGERPAKRVKMGSAAGPGLGGEMRSPRKLLGKNTGARLHGKAAGGLTAARLNMLATPKRRT
jgi:hypothetical protein